MYNFSEISEEDFRPSIRELFSMMFSNLIENKEFDKINTPLIFDLFTFGYDTLSEKRRNIIESEARCVLANKLNKNGFKISPDDIEVRIMEIES